jgi:integrase
MHESVHTLRMARPRKPSITLPPHVHRVVSRGKEYFTYQYARGTERAGPRVKLPHPADEGFLAAVRKAAGPLAHRPAAGSFEALIESYRESPEWKALSDATVRDYGRYLDVIKTLWGDLRVAELRASDILALRDKRAETPAAANYLIRVLSAAISWSVPRGYRTDNPCEHVRKLKIGDGWAPWPWEMIELVEKHAPAWMWQATALALYTGQRQGDCLAMSRAKIKNGLIEVKQEKTGRELVIPAHQKLLAVLDSMNRDSVQILTSTRGTPWTQDGFRASWAGEFEAPQQTRGVLPRQHPLWPIKRAGLVFHGLRKSAVVTLLEAGCTDAEVASITGQSRQMVDHYSRQVNQRKLAASAILKWENASGTEFVQRRDSNCTTAPEAKKTAG